MTVRDALAAAAARLAGASETPRLDAELLMAEALGISRETMLLSRLDEAAPAGFEPLLDRRLAHEPIAYILGRRAFWTIELEVGPGVLIPRPDSETLIEAALAHFGAAGPRTMLDLGTGPGTLLLAALDQWPDARGLGIDVSETALGYARRNAERLGLADRASFRLGDWQAEGRFDLILCNPPYVENDANLPGDVALWEPAEALFAGPDGLDDYRRLAPLVPGLIAAGGIACVEIGAGQAQSAGALFAAQGLGVTFRADLAGRDRCLLLRLDRG
jgi:release factor glutamine methyltransferase